MVRAMCLIVFLVVAEPLLTRVSQCVSCSYLEGVISEDFFLWSVSGGKLQMPLAPSSILQ